MKGYLILLISVLKVELEGAYYRCDDFAADQLHRDLLDAEHEMRINYG